MHPCFTPTQNVLDTTPRAVVVLGSTIPSIRQVLTRNVPKQRPFLEIVGGRAGMMYPPERLFLQEQFAPVHRHGRGSKKGKAGIFFNSSYSKVLEGYLPGKY